MNGNGQGGRDMRRSQGKVYSYVRVSGLAQTDESKDGLRRQQTRAEAWAQQYGVELDSELDLRDEGVSAFTGKNLNGGRLGQFLELVCQRVVETPCTLLIEQIDRFSRMDTLDAIVLFRDMIYAGVEVVCTKDGRRYNTDAIRKDPYTALLPLMVELIGANMYSDNLSKRVGSAWAAKRAKLANGEHHIYTTVCPGWLQAAPEGDATSVASDGRGFEVIPDRAAVLRRIYELRARGHGPGAIAKILNQEHVSTWPRILADGTVQLWKQGPRKGKPKMALFWERGAITRLLNHPAARGAYVAQGYGSSEGRQTKAERVVIENYYPVVIDSDLWERCQEAKFSAPQGSSQTRVPISIFAYGLAKCGHVDEHGRTCGATITTVEMGTSGNRRPSLMCSVARAWGSCPRRSIPLADAHRAFLLEAGMVLREPPGRDGDVSLQVTLQSAIAGLEAVEASYKHALLNPTLVGSRALADMAAAVESARTETEAIRQQMHRADSRLVRSRVDTALQELRREPWNVPALGAALRALWSEMVLNWDREEWTVHWRHSDSVTHVLPATLKSMGFE